MDQDGAQLIGEQINSNSSQIAEMIKSDIRKPFANKITGSLIDEIVNADPVVYASLNFIS